MMMCVDLGADRGPGEEHCCSTAGHPQQRGSTESSSVQTLSALPETQHGALQRSPPAQVHMYILSLLYYYEPLPPVSLFILFASCICSLEGEVRQIDATLASLHQQLSEAKGSLSHLEESRITLEKDINCKTHSLFIEREKCMTHRKRYPTISTLSGYWRWRLRVFGWILLWFCDFKFRILDCFVSLLCRCENQSETWKLSSKKHIQQDFTSLNI